MFYIGLLRGHKMLMNSGLTGRERVGILTATGNRTDYKAITTGLRQQWEDAELRERDGQARRHDAHNAQWSWQQPEPDVFSFGGNDEPPTEEPQYPAPVPVEESTICGVP